MVRNKRPCVADSREPLEQRKTRIARVFLCCWGSNLSGVFPVHVIRIEAWVPKPVLTAARAGVVEVRGATEAEEKTAPWSQGGVAGTEQVGLVARDGTAIEMTGRQFAVEQDGAGAGPAVSGVEAEPAGFQAGWGGPEVGEDGCPVERAASEAESDVPEVAWVELAGSLAALGVPAAAWFEPAAFEADRDESRVGRDGRAAQPGDFPVERRGG
jgi:hypothetical protein